MVRLHTVLFMALAFSRSPNLRAQEGSVATACDRVSENVEFQRVGLSREELNAVENISNMIDRDAGAPSSMVLYGVRTLPSGMSLQETVEAAKILTKGSVGQVAYWLTEFYLVKGWSLYRSDVANLRQHPAGFQYSERLAVWQFKKTIALTRAAPGDRAFWSPYSFSELVPPKKMSESERKSAKNILIQLLKLGGDTDVAQMEQDAGAILQLLPNHLLATDIPGLSRLQVYERLLDRPIRAKVDPGLLASLITQLDELIAGTPPKL